MSYLDKSLKEMHEALKNGDVTSKELVEESLKRAHSSQEELNGFVTICDDAKELEVTDNVLSGIPYAAKDNLSTKGVLTTASSNILSNYVPVFDATCIKKLKDANAVMIGKTVMDELGMGGTGTTGHTGIVKNPWDTTRMTAGSSAGSAAAVAKGIVPYALGTDTGDSIRKPAAYCGVVGVKPTYGLVSRWGLFAFASSLDHIGCFAKKVEDAAYVIENMKGKDENDMTSFDSSSIKLVDNLNNDVNGKKLFYIKELVDAIRDDEAYYNNFMSVVEHAKSLGIEVSEESIDATLLKSLEPVYKAISCAEATSNNSNLTGIPFGNRKEGRTPDEVMINTRTEGFCELIRRRFVIGSFILQKENQEKLFKNAQRVRRMIVDKITELFKEYDGYIVPAFDRIAPHFDETFDTLSDRYLLYSEHLAIANFGGFPSITIPSGLIDGMPVAINITTNVMKDDVMFNIANKLEEKIGFTPLSLKEEK